MARRIRIPEGDDWKDHAEPCQHCGEPVMTTQEHWTAATMVDPGWWSCDMADEEE